MADNSIIDLVSSDDEEVKVIAAPSTVRKPNKARRRSKPVTPDDIHRFKKEDKSDDNFLFSSEKLKPNTKKPRQRQLNFSLDSSSDEEDDDLFLFAKKKTKATAAPAASGSPTKKARPASSKENLKPVAIEFQDSNSVTTDNVCKPKRVPVYNPYAKRPSTVSSATTDSSNTSSSTIPTQTLAYPDPSAQTYPDLRPQFILAFWRHAQTLVHASYNLNKMDQMCRRINSLVFSQYPIRSLDEYCERFTHTADAASIKEILKKGTKFTASNTRGYVSIAEACLVALLEHVQSLLSGEDTDPSQLLSQKSYWIALSSLLPMIDSRLQPSCPRRLALPDHDDNGAAFYLQASTRSAEFKQLEKLETKAQGQYMSYIKRHRQKGQVYYELTTLGFQTAMDIRQRAFPAPLGHYRTSNLQEVQPKFQGIFLAVDNREGGGVKLHKTICNKLDTLKMPYFVRQLKIGDYCLFTQDSKLVPVLVERKSIQDIAASMDDQRWTKQKQRMYQGQHVFGFENSRMAFIIEGKIETQLVTGNYVADRRYNVTQEQLDNAIANLESEGFEVLRTLSMEHSMVELSRWAIGVRKDHMEGKLKAQYTYQEFLREVGKIPKQTDFSRIAKDRAATAKDFEIKRQSTTLDKKPKPDTQRKLVFGQAPNSKKNESYSGWSVAQLKKECEKFGLAKSGKKSDLIDRLNGPKPPKLWLQRKARDVGYVPSRYNSCATALLVGVWLEQSKADENWKGLTKEELYPLAESLDISKDPFSGVATGPYKYDGWSSMSELRGGEIPLVVLKKGRYLLTTSSDVSGYPLAEAMHRWCHEHNSCKCEEAGYEYNDS